MTPRFVRIMKAITLSILMGSSFSISADLNNNEVEFTGAIQSVLANGDGGGTLFIRFSIVDLRVIVNAHTEVEGRDGLPLPLDALLADDFVKVVGKFSSGAILATSVRLLDSADTDFNIRGHITGLMEIGGSTYISMLGLRIVANDGTSVEQDGVTVNSSALKHGLRVQAEGSIVDNVWTAANLQILTNQSKPANLRFEGTITEIQSNQIMVQVAGLTSNVTPVHHGPKTKIFGTLAVGALVQVHGTVGTDLSVEARQIRVLQALEIKPEDRKLKQGQSADFIVKLRETAAANVVVTLTSSDPSVVSLSKAQVTISQGSKTADFSATGLALGTAEIKAAALGQEALASVTVGSISAEESEKSSGSSAISFAPSKIKMGLNERRDVVVHVKPPPKAQVAIDFSVKNNLVVVAGDRVLGNGAAVMKITIESSDKEGTDAVVATLPAAFGGGTAELIVEVAGKKK